MRFFRWKNDYAQRCDGLQLMLIKQLFRIKSFDPLQFLWSTAKIFFGTFRNGLFNGFTILCITGVEYKARTTGGSSSKNEGLYTFSSIHCRCSNILCFTLFYTIIGSPPGKCHNGPGTVLIRL